MNNLAATTSVERDKALYFARVITFDFVTNGISMPFFRQNLKEMRS